eukprot:m.131669 g.131669  ORF g.131669 m.131669 type:complete len:106 (+) comp13076_c0_seq3:1060-1377(+)
MRFERNPPFPVHGTTFWNGSLKEKRSHFIKTFVGNAKSTLDMIFGNKIIPTDCCMKFNGKTPLNPSMLFIGKLLFHTTSDLNNVQEFICYCYCIYKNVVALLNFP